MSTSGSVAPARKVWPKATYQKAMALKPPSLDLPVVIDIWYRALPEGDRWPTKYLAAKLTGVPPSTILGWWQGDTPSVKGRPVYKSHRAIHCVNGHRQKGKTVYRRPDGTRECAICRRENVRRHRYRSQFIFHPKYNPDPELAPLHHLWVLGDDMVALVLESYTQAEVLQIFGKNTHAQNRWFEMTSKRKKWLRFDAADRILSELALNPLGLAHPPTYSTTRPEDTC